MSYFFFSFLFFFFLVVGVFFCHPVFLACMEHFSLPISIPIAWQYILPVCIRVFYSFSFLANMYIKWLIFSYDLLSLYPALNFLRKWFSGTSNFNGICISESLLLLSLSLLLSIPSLHVSMVFSVNCMTPSGIWYILRQCNIYLWGTIL